MNITTARPLGSVAARGEGVEAELDRLLDLDALLTPPARTPAMASPLCLCWPDEDER